MKTISLSLGEHSYDIVFGNSFKYIEKYTRAIVVTDENVNKHYPDYFGDIPKIVLPSGEQSKSHEQLIKIYEQLIKHKITRTDLIIAFGGGVVGDITGYAAATFLRGVDFVQVPTTLLAQVDSSVGGKVAINLPLGKNMVGCFYQPKQVMINTEFLKTLPERNFSEGMAEVIKYAAIADKEMFDMLGNGDYSLEDAIASCCDIKRKFVESDQFDRGERMLLNFGHTLGHGVEQYYDYRKYSHGEGVAIGMYNITMASQKLGITVSGTADRIKELLIKYNLPYTLDVPPHQMIEAMRRDKKAVGEYINLVLLKDIGRAFIKQVHIRELDEYIGA